MDLVWLMEVGFVVGCLECLLVAVVRKLCLI